MRHNQTTAIPVLPCLDLLPQNVNSGLLEPACAPPPMGLLEQIEPAYVKSHGQLSLDIGTLLADKESADFVFVLPSDDGLAEVWGVDITRGQNWRHSMLCVLWYRYPSLKSVFFHHPP